MVGDHLPRSRERGDFEFQWRNLSAGSGWRKPTLDGSIEHMCVWCVWHSGYDSFYSPDLPQGAMVLFDRAAVYEDRAEAERVAAELNEASNRSTLDARVDPWLVVEG